MGDPNRTYNPLICGIGIGCVASAPPPGSDGSIGCFVTHPVHGDCMLTNDHVLVVAKNDNNHGVCQPGNIVAQRIGNWVAHYHPAVPSNGDSCLTKIPNPIPRPYMNRTYSPAPGNPLVNLPSLANDSQIINKAVNNAKVYKYGLATRVTTGFVAAYPHNVVAPAGQTLFTNTIQIVGADNGVWAGPGDSGSPLVSVQGNVLVGLNFEIEQGVNPPVGFAYPMNQQMAALGAIGYIVPPPLAGQAEVEPLPEADPLVVQQHAKLVRLMNSIMPTLLADPNVTHVGIGTKIVHNQRTKKLALIISVEEKKPMADIAENLRIPPHYEFEGEALLTDVQQRARFRNPTSLRGMEGTQ